MNALKYALTTFAALTISACALVTEHLVGDGYDQMNGSEIASALIGNSLDGKDSDGRYVIHYETASTMRIQYQGRVDEGVWRIDGDHYCRRWSSFGNGKERCVRFYRSGDKIKWVRHGRITDYSTLLRGNPAGL